MGKLASYKVLLEYIDPSGGPILGDDVDDETAPSELVDTEERV